MRNQKNIIIIPTIDYEIFGNGTGDVMECLINPTYTLNNLSNKYGIKLTYFFEAAEYFKFEENDTALKRNLGYSPADEIKKQLLSLKQAGHDIQLHFHPQWLDAKYDSFINKWVVDFSKWRVGDLDFSTIDFFLKKGKKLLENLLRPIDSDYHCIAFRAGAWSLQPEKNIYKALKKNNFEIDSSVALNQKSNDKLAKYNFTNVPNLPYWKFNETLKNIQGNGILEIPIYSYKTNFLKTVVQIAKNKVIKSKTKKNITGSYAINPIRNIINVFFNNQRSIDLSNVTSKDFEEIISNIHTQKKIPLVLIGHSKDFSQFQTIEKLFEKLQDFKVSTISEFYKEISIEDA